MLTLCAGGVPVLVKALEMKWGLACSATHLLRCLARGQAEEQQAVVKELLNVQQLYTMSNLLYPVCGKGEEETDILGDHCCSARTYIGPETTPFATSRLW